jgi:hypothetical protein
MSYSIERVVLTSGQEDIAETYRRNGLNAYVQDLPFGIQVPESWKNEPSELISVGGSVAFEFAIPAILLSKELFPHLKYVHLGVDEDTHFTTPEGVDYEVVPNCLTETAAKYSCKAWSEDEFRQLTKIKTQAECHYFLRNFYRKNVMILREDNSTIIKYFGGAHDGEVIQMQGPPMAIEQLGIGRSVNRPDGKIDIYETKIVGRVLECHYIQTVQHPKAP